MQAKAQKRPGRGRPSGRMIIAFNTMKFSELDKQVTDNCILLRLKTGNTEMIICCCYIRETDDIPTFFSNYDDMLRVLLRGQPEVPVFLCGDFNSRIANLNSFNNGLSLPNVSSTRHSKDMIVNKRGQKLCEELEQRNLIVLNGRTPGDIPANFTFIDKRGTSTIDLMCTSTTNTALVQELRTMDIVSQSDHDAIMLQLDIGAPEDNDQPSRRRLRWEQRKRTSIKKKWRKMQHLWFRTKVWTRSMTIWGVTSSMQLTRQGCTEDQETPERGGTSGSTQAVGK